MSEDKPSSNPNHGLLEQYKSYVEDLGNIGTRQENSRKFYLSVASALLALLSVAGEQGHFQEVQRPVKIVVGVAGVSLCILWFFHMRSFGALYLAKFTVLKEMEVSLPFPIFKREWELLKSDCRYMLLSYIDSKMPFIYSVLFVAIIFFKW